MVGWFTRPLVLVGVLTTAFLIAAQIARGDEIPRWAVAAHRQAASIADFTHRNDQQRTPPVIPKLDLDFDSNGIIETYQPDGATLTTNNSFFQNLGTNGRTCFTCHQPQTGWTITPSTVQARFEQSKGTDPIFRLIDGATCPSDEVSTLASKRQAYSLLLQKGLIRIGLPMPAPSALQFAITDVQDPYNCNNGSAFGLTSSTTGMASVYRRPLPSTNLGFLSTFMWDGREPSLLSQALDATLIHAQAATAPGTNQLPQNVQDQLQNAVSFEQGVFTAQAFDFRALLLNSGGATGGPIALSQQPFFIGINDPLGNNPEGIPFTSTIFDLYGAWENLPGNSHLAAYRESVARGQTVFNTKPINITGVAGLNDVLGIETIPGFCGTCHDSPNAGDHSVKAPLNIGVADPNPPGLDNSGLPVFTLQCFAGPANLLGHPIQTTDPGRALITGNCADIGRLKGPILRGLASRAPYFHNGAAASLMDVVTFYDQRFTIGFTDQEKHDLVNFLNTL
jgi:cytochrome c peroxidase